MHVRRKLVAGNWKMNGSIGQLAEVQAIADAARAAGGVDVAVCPPFTLIAPAVTRAGGMTIGGQDCHAEDSGAHTGSISAAMIKEATRSNPKVMIRRIPATDHLMGTGTPDSGGPVSREYVRGLVEWLGGT